MYRVRTLSKTVLTKDYVSIYRSSIFAPIKLTTLNSRIHTRLSQRLWRAQSDNIIDQNRSNLAILTGALVKSIPCSNSTYVRILWLDRNRLWASPRQSILSSVSSNDLYFEYFGKATSYLVPNHWIYRKPEGANSPSQESFALEL